MRTRRSVVRACSALMRFSIFEIEMKEKQKRLFIRKTEQSRNFMDYNGDSNTPFQDDPKDVQIWSLNA